MDGLGARERRERGREGGGRKRGSRKKEEWEERENADYAAAVL